MTKKRDDTLVDFVELKVQGSLECGSCGEILEESYSGLVGTGRAMVIKELIDQAEKAGWAVTDLDGQLDGRMPVCKNCQEDKG